MSAVTTTMLPGHLGAELAVHSIGTGRPVVLLHGLFSSAEMNWIKWGHAALLAEAGFQAIMPDLRGHGQSAKPHDPAAWPDDVLALDLIALIGELGLGDYDLVGFSMGSRTSVRGIIRGLAPRRLVLGGMGLEGLAGWSGRRAHFIDAIERFGTIRPGDDAYMTQQFMKSMAIDRVAARLLLDTLTDTQPEALATLTMPTMVLCGDQDRDNGSPERLTETLPHAVHVVVPGTHMGCVTQPPLGAAIRDFLID